VADQLNLSSDELLSTTRTVRLRLDLERLVDREVVDECLRLALQGPSAENGQPWSWVLVDDLDIKQAMGEIYRQSIKDFVVEFRAAVAAGDVDPRARMGIDPPDQDDPGTGRITRSFDWLRRNMEHAPVLAVPMIRARLEGMSLFETASLWGSVIPAAWSFMLALRSRGLGSAWTTAHLRREPQMAELLGIPGDRMTQVGLFPVAYTVGTDFRPGVRRELEGVRTWNRWSE
jgi:nitroreductase